MARYSLSIPPSPLLIKPKIPHSSSSSDAASFPIVVIGVIGIFSTAFLLVSYYVFVIRCCLNWHLIDLLGRFSVTRRRDTLTALYSPSAVRCGLEESVIRSIPILKFNTGITKTEYVECAVCLSEFKEDEKLRIIPNCAHVFHLDCIDVWLQSSTNCPLCRRSISSAFLCLSMEDPVGSPSPASVARNENSHIELGNDGTNESPFERLISPLPIKRAATTKLGFVVQMSFGDECIEINREKKGDGFGGRIQAMRRSFSLDSSNDPQFVQLIQSMVQEQKRFVRRDCGGVPAECCSNSRLRR